MGLCEIRPENTQMDKVKFNVGGKIFETTTTTLVAVGRQSMLGALLDENWNTGGKTGEYFIDRNPACFAVLLDLLRTGSLYIPPTMPVNLLYREAIYYGLLDNVRAAKWGPLDGNLLQHSNSIFGAAPGDGTAIRAGPDGGCCVAHGSLVHVYDWMLQHHRPITLDYRRVNDVGYIDETNIVITAAERIGKDDCGMAVFSSPAGELTHRFQVSHDNQFKTFSAGALAFSSDDKIFASCKGRCNEYGIGVWDQITGKQTDFFYESPGCSLGDADKLQWLTDTKCLMVATLFPKADYCYIGLLDFRQKNVVWSWSDAGNTTVPSNEKRVLDAVAMDDGQSICVVNQYDDLGFMDIRRNSGGIRWSSRSRLMKGKMADEELCYPKLAIFDGQLFSSMNDSISVFCGPERVLTAQLKRGRGGAICDFSIGGDRLFALHSEENVFDVWETPPSRIM